MPKYIKIVNDKVRVSYCKNMNFSGHFDCSKKIIKINPKDNNIGECLMHEIMEYLAGIQFSIYDKSSGRRIEFFHSPESHNDTWTIYVQNLIDTIRRNKLTNLLFGDK